VGVGRAAVRRAGILYHQAHVMVCFLIDFYKGTIRADSAFAFGRQSVLRPLRGRLRLFLFDSPWAVRPRTPDLLLARAKSRQKRARTNGSGLLSRGRLWAAASAGE
jgi:hypothetical protein